MSKRKDSEKLMVKDIIELESHVKVNIKDTKSYLYEDFVNIADLNGLILEVKNIGIGLICVDDGENNRLCLGMEDIEITNENLSKDIPVIVYKKNNDNGDNYSEYYSFYRDFEIVSNYTEKIDENFIPRRADDGSAGYDFKAAEDIVIPSLFKKFLVSHSVNSSVNSDNEVMTIGQAENFNKINKFKATMIPTGIKAKMPKDEVLKIYPRSSVGCKSLLMMPNDVGIIDSSYYNNPDNEGHIYIPLINLSPIDILIKKGATI